MRSNRAAPAWSPMRSSAFIEKGFLLKSGEELEPHILVTAKGLVMQTFGGAELSVDRRTRRSRPDVGLQRCDDVWRAESCFRVRLHQRFVDAESRPDLRLCVSAVKLHGQERRLPSHAEEEPRRDGCSPVCRELHARLHQARAGELAEVGVKAPWRVYQNYIRDTISLKWSPVDNKAVEFSNPPRASSTPVTSQQPARLLAQCR